MSLLRQMESPTHSWSLQKLTIVLFFFCISSSSQVEASTSSRKLDYPVVSQPPDTEIKCGSCPCGNSCGEQLPPPPPPPPSSPPPPPEYSSSQNCNPPPPPPPSPPPPSPPPPLPPPPPRFIYVTGVPGDVYQTNPYNWVYYNSAAQNRAVGLLVLAGLGALLVTMVFE